LLSVGGGIRETIILPAFPGAMRLHQSVSCPILRLPSDVLCQTIGSVIQSSGTCRLPY
jgi:hypothetical protein